MELKLSDGKKRKFIKIECEDIPSIESIRTMRYEGMFDGLHRFTDWLGILEFKADENFIVGNEYEFKDLPF